MSGRFGGLRTLVQCVVVNAKWTHYLVHHEALASQQLSGGDLNPFHSKIQEGKEI